MWRRLTATVLVLAGVLMAFWLWRAPAFAAPYVSCPGGYIADNYGDCPQVPKHPVGGPRSGGGGNPGSSGGGGVLGGLLGHLGLGGLL